MMVVAKMPTERSGLVRYRARLNRYLRNLGRNPRDRENLGNLPGLTGCNSSGRRAMQRNRALYVGLDSDFGSKVVLSKASGWSDSGSAIRMLSLPAKRSSISVPITWARHP